MVQEVETLEAELSIKDAIDRTKDLDVTGFPVVDPEGRMLGIISEANLRQAQAAGMEEQTVIEAATTSYIIHAHPDQSLDSAMAKLGARQISRLPVVSREDPTRLLGIITVEDVMKAFGESIEDPGGAGLAGPAGEKEARKG